MNLIRPHTIVIALSSVLFSVGVTACDDRTPEPKPEPPPKQAVATADPSTARQEAPTVVEATEAGKAIAAIDANIAFHRKKIETNDAWIHYDAIANARIARARLTGSVDDYVAARDAVEKALSFDVTGSAPHITRARLNLAIHRVREVEADLDAIQKKVLVDDAERADVAGMRGDVAFQTGKLPEALEKYRESEKIRPTLSSAGRLANFSLKTGAFDEARRWYEKAAERGKGSDGQRAWALLHRGVVELELGRHEDAEKWFRKADDEFDGWYLVEEHIAEVRLLRGHPDEAIEIYESVLARVPNGEFMAAMADAHEANGAGDEAKKWREKARAAFERDIARLPSAASGHAIEFFVDHAPARAVELAEANFETRPGHEARVMLANAYWANGERDKAWETLGPLATEKPEGPTWSTEGALQMLAVAGRSFDEGIAGRAAQRGMDLYGDDFAAEAMK